MNRQISHFVMVLGMLLLYRGAEAHVIKQGTISVDVSAFNLSRSLEQGTDSDEQEISLLGSYFFRDNFEIGTTLSYDHFRSDPLKRTSWSLAPTVLYHIPVDDKANVYVGGGVFVTDSDTSFSSGNKTSDESAGFTLSAGWEYFFNDNIALDIDFSYKRVSWDLTGHSVTSDKESRFYWPRIGFRLFF